MHPCHQAALEYHGLGLHPIPCATRSKRPLVKWQDFQERQPTSEEIASWWSEWPDANVALVLGRGIFAIDADGGLAALRLLREHGADVPAAPTSRTAKGLHILLSSPGPVPDRVALLRSEDRTAQVDIRGVGIIVAPPSIHPSGVQYAWEIPLTLPLPPAPQALLDLIQTGRAKAHDQVGSSWVIEALRGVPHGLRDDTCAKLAGFFLHAGLDPATTEAVLCASFAEHCDPPFAHADVRKTVQSIARKDARDGAGQRIILPVALSAAIMDWERSLDSGPVRRIRTPIPELNGLLGGGLSPGELVYLGARPGVGKTALALEIARTAAQDRHGVLFVSREMVRANLVARIIAQAGRIRAGAVRAWDLSHAETHTYMARLRGELMQLPLWLTDEAVSIEEIAGLLDTFRGSPPISLLVVDYLQLVRAPREIRERRLQVEAVSQALKGLAVQYRLPVLCLSSLRRPEIGNPDRRPGLQDLRESGELEHDADVIVLMHRGFEAEDTEIAVAKNRNGRLGVVHVLFRSEFLRFEPVTP